MENVEVDIQQELRLKLAQGIRNDGRKMTESRQISNFNQYFNKD